MLDLYQTHKYSLLSSLLNQSSVKQISTFNITYSISIFRKIQYSLKCLINQLAFVHYESRRLICNDLRCTNTLKIDQIWSDCLWSSQTIENQSYCSLHSNLTIFLRQDSKQFQLCSNHSHVLMKTVQHKSKQHTVHTQVYPIQRSWWEGYFCRGLTNKHFVTQGTVLDNA